MAAIVAAAISLPMVMGNPDTANSEATVENSPPYICCKWEEARGEEIIGTLVPNSMLAGPLTVTIVACVCDPNGNDDIDTVQATVVTTAGTVPVNLQPDSTVDCTPCICIDPAIPCIGYSGTFTLDPCDASGVITVTVVANDGTDDSEPVFNEFLYESLELLAINFDRVEFAGKAGDTNIPGVEIDCNGIVVPSTITSIGNDVIDVSIDATDLTYNGNSIPVPPNMQAQVGSSGYQVLTDAGDPSTTPTCFDADLACGGTTTVDFELDIPSGTPKGTYGGNIYICACSP